MKKIIMLTAMILLFTTIVQSDVQIGGRSRLDTQTGIYHQMQNLKFNDNSVGFIGSTYGYRPIKIDFIRSCEDITQFNTDNLNNKVINVSWKLTHLINTYTTSGTPQNTTETIEGYGCDGDTDCNDGNTPYGETGGIIRETYRVGHGDNIYIEMITLFNNSNEAVYDSPCTFESRVGTYSCNGGCSDFTYEELVNEVETREQLTEHSTNTTNTMLTIITYNLTVWEIALWALKMLVVLGIIVGIISTIFLIYRKIKGVQGDI